MDETTKILIGTISGFIIAFLAEPVKTYFSNKTKSRHLRIALYKEMIQNYLILDQTLIERKNNKKSNLLVAQPLLINDCYKYAISQETTLYYQINEARLINSFYKIINILLNTSNTKDEYNSVFIKHLIEGAVGLVESGLDIGVLDKSIAEKVTSKTEVKRIFSSISNKFRS